MLHMSASAGANGPSVASSQAIPIRQGEKRKWDGEQPPPPTQNPGVTGSVTRQRIVEILSNTANGCLSELGYYPGMPGRLKDLEIQNAKWRDENVKLFQDNQRLSSMVQALNTNVALSGIPESGKTQQILDLQNEVKRLQVENEQTRKLLQIPQWEYAKILEKHNKLVQSYHSVYQENQHLKAQLNGLLRNQQYPNVPRQLQQNDTSHHPSFLTTQRNVAVLPNSNSNAQQPQLVQVGVGHMQGQQSPTAQSPSHSLQRSPDQVQGSELTQTQYAVLQNRQHSHSNPSSRRSSLNLISPLMQLPQVPSQPYNPPIQPNLGSQMQAIQKQYHALDSTRQMLPFGNTLQQTTRRASAPSVANQYGHPHPLVQTSRIHSDAAEPGSASVTLAISSQSPQISPPVLPTVSRIRPTFGQAPSGSPTDVSQNLLSSQIGHNVEPMVTTISPQDIYLNTPVTVQAQLLPDASASHQPLIDQDAPLQDVEDINTMPLVPSPSTNIPSANASMPPGPHSLNPSPRSESPPKSGESDTTPAERLQSEGNPSGPVDSVEASQNTLASVAPDAMQVDSREDDSESDEEIELGPDGLRLVKDCLEQLFGLPADGQVTCKLCEHRFREGIQDKPPIPFVNATDKELEDHCIEEHQYAWEVLRNPE